MKKIYLIIIITISVILNAILFVPQLFGFSNSAGTLDSQGNAQVTWNIPNMQGASGTQLHFSFITLQYNSQSQATIRSIAPAVNVTLQ